MSITTGCFSSGTATFSEQFKRENTTYKMCLCYFSMQIGFVKKFTPTLILDAATKHGDGVIPTSSTRPLAQIACISTGPPGDSNLNDVIGSVIFTWPVSLIEIAKDII